MLRMPFPLAASFEDQPIPSFYVAPGAEYVALGSQIVDLRTRSQLRRILLALVEENRRAPGRALSAEHVFAVGWPGELASPKAAGARVYTAIYTLRRMGLRGMLVRRGDGYLIDPRVSVDTSAPELRAS